MDAQHVLTCHFTGYRPSWSPEMEANRALAALAAAGYRVVKVDEDTKARAAREFAREQQFRQWYEPHRTLEEKAVLCLDAALAVLEGDEHE